MRIVLFANTDWYLFNFRLALAKALRAAGHEVVLLSPPGEWGPRLRAEGFDWRAFRLARRSMNPFTELATATRLAGVYREIRPDVAHHFTIKCVLYGALAARLAGVPRVVSSITGLGHMMLSSSFAARLLRPLILGMHRLLLRGGDVIFQNHDNLALFERHGLLRHARSHMIPGSGVDPQRFDTAPPPADLPPVVLMMGRLLWAKGVETFVEAARRVRERRPDVEFWLAGERDEGNPDCIPQGRIAAWAAEGHVKFLGHRDDVPALNARATVVALPSHGEGMPRTLLEAAASARPLVASDVPGCREVVCHGENGWLFPVKDAAAMADAILDLLGDPARAREFGAAARRDVEHRYADAINIQRTLSVYEGQA